jgi:hypothetical protein
VAFAAVALVLHLGWDFHWYRLDDRGPSTDVCGCFCTCDSVAFN